MGQLRSLGPAGGARRVEEGGHVVRHRPGRPRRAASAPVDLVHAAHDQGGVGVGHDVGHLVRPHLRVDRHRDAPGPRRGQAQQEQLVVVRRVEDDPVAGRGLGGDATGPPVHPLGGLAVGELAPVLVGHEPAAAVHLGQVVQQRARGWCRDAAPGAPGSAHAPGPQLTAPHLAMLTRRWRRPPVVRASRAGPSSGGAPSRRRRRSARSAYGLLAAALDAQDDALAERVVAHVVADRRARSGRPRSAAAASARARPRRPARGARPSPGSAGAARRRADRRGPVTRPPEPRPSLPDRAAPRAATAALDLLDQALGDLVEEPARRVVLGGAVERAAPGVGQVEPLRARVMPT